MNAGYFQKGFNGIVHKIMAAASMNVNVDKTRANIFSAGVNCYRFGRFYVTFAYRDDLAITHQYSSAIDDTVWRYDPAVKYFKLLFHKFIKDQFFLDKRS